MIGIGTLIDSAAIAAGGVLGHFAGRFFKPSQQEAMTNACGVSVLFIAIAGAMEGMLQIKDGSLTSGKSMLITLCLAIGTLIGELLRIDEGFQRLGLWLKEKTGSAGGTGFVDAFVTTSVTFSVGAMSIMGAIRDGLLGDYSTLAAKGVLDFVLVVVMASSMGIGCAFSAIPVLIFQGGMTLLARVLAPVLTDQAVSYLSIVGSVTIFCIGVNMVWGKNIRVANMLPAVLLAVLAAFLPWSL